MSELENPELVMDEFEHPQIDCNSWCSSRLEENVLHTFIWTIHQFSDWNHDNGQFIQSSIFTVKGDEHESKWSIILYPNGNNSENEGHLALFLQCENTSATKVRKYSLRLVDKHSNPVHGFHGVNSQFNSDNGFRNPTGGYWGRSFMSRDLLERKKDDFLNNDALTILCCIQIVGKQVNQLGVNHIDGPVKEIGLDVCRKKLADDLEELFNSEEEADVEICCRGRIFRCHKLLLVTRSPVFKAMFGNQMKEQSSHRVDIPDMDPQVLKEMLRFMYTGSCLDIPLHTGDLLAASEKYSLPELKLMCATELCRSLDLDNCLDRLVLADLYALGALKDLALQLAATNISLLLKSPQWARDIENNAILLAELVRVLASSKSL